MWGQFSNKDIASNSSRFSNFTAALNSWSSSSLHVEGSDGVGDVTMVSDSSGIVVVVKIIALSVESSEPWRIETAMPAPIAIAKALAMAKMAQHILCRLQQVPDSEP